MSRWPYHKAQFWQEAPACRPLLGLCAGILIYECCPSLRTAFNTCLIALALLSIAIVLIGFSRRRSFIQFGLFPILFWLFLGMIGCAASMFNDPRTHLRWFGNQLDSSAGWLLKMSEKPQRRTKSFRAQAEVIGRFQNMEQQKTAGRALLYFSKDCKDLPDSGDTILVSENFTAIRSSSNPFAFDFRRFQNRQGVFFQQFLRPGSYLLIGSKKPSERSLIDNVHRWCDLQLSSYLRDSATRGLLQAMILGDEQSLDPELRQTYSETGVVHIVSISGAHVAVLFLVVTGLLHWIRGPKGKWVRYLAGLLLVWWYVMMAGAPPSALRSAVMFSVIALSALSGMQGQGLNTLAAAAFVLLIGNPSWLFSVGFQLSFLAVLSMMLFYQPLFAMWPGKSWLGIKLGQALAASFAAEILTAPLVIFYFHNFPLYFLIANLLAGILVGMLALIGGMAVILTSQIPPLATCIAWLLQNAVHFFNQIMQCLQKGTPDAFHFLQIDITELLLLYLSLAAFAVFFLQKDKRLLWIALPALIVLIFLLNDDVIHSKNQERFIVYENGSKPLVERIRGNYFQRIIGEPKEQFSTQGVHTAWNAWRASVFKNDLLFRIGSRQVLVLNDWSGMKRSFPVDVLVWAGTSKPPEPELLWEVYRPKALVFATSLWSAKREDWARCCARHRTLLHEVGKDGAFVLP